MILLYYKGNKKGEKMKKLITLALAVSMAFVLVSCGGGKDPKKTKKADKTPVVKVMDKMGDQPMWVEMGDATGKNDGKKVIFFIGYGESKFKDTAKEAAQLNAATAAATAISAVATKQVAKAWESIGAGDNEQKEQVMKGLEALSAKKVNVGGLRKVSAWWRFAAKSKIVNGKVVGWAQPQYEYYVRYAMNYDTYTARRDGVIDAAKKGKKLNSRQKKLYADMEKKLDELDEE